VIKFKPTSRFLLTNALQQTALGVLALSAFCAAPSALAAWEPTKPWSSWCPRALAAVQTKWHV